MKDLQARYEKLMADATDCDVVSNLAQNVQKRAMFRRLAEQYRQMAARIRQEIDKEKVSDA